MTRKQAVKELFNQNRTETLWGTEVARRNRMLVVKRKSAKARRSK